MATKINAIIPGDIDADFPELALFSIVLENEKAVIDEVFVVDEVVGGEVVDELVVEEVVVVVVDELVVVVDELVVVEEVVVVVVNEVVVIVVVVVDVVVDDEVVVDEVDVIVVDEVDDVVADDFVLITVKKMSFFAWYLSLNVSNTQVHLPSSSEVTDLSFNLHFFL